MATDGTVGRAVVFTWNSASILGVREKDLTCAGAAIDVTSDDNAGIQKLLTVSAQDSLEIKLSGVTKSDALKTDWFAGTRTRTATLTYPNGATLSGTFYMSAYSEKAPYKDAQTFDATLQSSGAFTFTPGT